MTPLAAILGCSGLVLSDLERAFFTDVQPLGFILFARNCDNPDQVRELVNSLRRCVDRADAPVLIDQEGGRVQRLKPPHWRDAPAAYSFVTLYQKDPGLAIDAVRLNARLIAHELAELGINVDCAPLLDVVQAGADPIIGDRAFGNDPATISALGRAACEGFLMGGVLPVIKHIPGHGRANVDSHKQLPQVDADLETLSETDFAPFRALKAMPWAMSAHVLYSALDVNRPATLSPDIITMIRNDLGFEGVLVSDDLSMQALSGTLGERTGLAMAAGCDVALHCNGDMDEMKMVTGNCGDLTGDAVSRIERGTSIGRENRVALVEEFSDAVQTLATMMAGEGN
ncbi:MAG: beta-N-acetylhexosaminidase [Rhodospirillaceae bacterium]|nr:beta-N-acetylhexosaminidase [Rhodospirillaceae bacterium]MBL6930984.1 beta-N-acetylhexosaminidase [Rhodospirillales bacterium]MBL6941909.1 beta-N-acetylhexosaminidase [Rhodospirillales bacterium]